MPSFTCQTCGQGFDVAQAALDKYPGWTPRSCLSCRDQKPGRRKKTNARSPRGAGAGRSIQVVQTLDEVLSGHHGGPRSGVFTDGSAQPNPGPGGWGAVYVVDDDIIDQQYGHEPHTTNNRMELMALIAGYKMVPDGKKAVVYTDSDLCVRSMLEWAPGWARRGWRRKSGPIKNLDLVQELYALVCARPEIELRWIKAHDGSRYNEYADSLATAWARDTL